MHNFRPTIDWSSSKQMRKAAVHVQAKILENVPEAVRRVLPKFRLVQIGVIPSQKAILDGLCNGMYLNYLHAPKTPRR